MSRPLGLSQADYDELEFPSRAAEPLSPDCRLNLWESALFLVLCALFLVVIAFFAVTAQLCRKESK